MEKIEGPLRMGKGNGNQGLAVIEKQKAELGSYQR